MRTLLRQRAAGRLTSRDSSAAPSRSAFGDSTGVLSRWSRIALGVGTFTVAVLASLVAAYFAIFSQVAIHDDEGYVLVSLKEFLEGGALYDEVYSQYGPFFYEFVGALISLPGFDVSHDSGRLLTLFFWTGTSVLTGLAALRIARHWLAAIAVSLLTFELLFSYPGEPLHPGIVLTFLLAAVVAVAVFFVPVRPTATFFALAVLITAAALVKINVGGLAAIALVVSAALAFRPPGRDWLARGAVALLVLTPFLLMYPKLGDGWGDGLALPLAALVAIAGLAVGLTAIASPRPKGAQENAAPLRWLLAAAAGGVLTVLVVGGVALLTGTSLTGLVDGVIVDPLAQPVVLFGIVAIPSLALNVAVIGAGLAALLAWSRARVDVLGAWQPLLASARLAAGATIWFALQGSSPIGLPVALAWVAALPTARDGADLRIRFIRVFVPVLGVLETLHAYPVSGSQIAWSSFLLAVAGAICLADGVTELTAWAAAKPVSAGVDLARRAAVVLFAVLLVKVAFVSLALPFQDERRAYRSGVSLELPGAERLRVPLETALALRWVVDELSSRCTTFVSLPGLNSFYLFADMEPPTNLNATSWMFLFDSRRQQTMVDAVADRPGVCAIRHGFLLDFWRQGREIPDRPLVRFIRDEFEPASSRAGYEILVRAR